MQLEEDQVAEPRVTSSRKAAINLGTECLGKPLLVHDDNLTIIHHS